MICCTLKVHNSMSISSGKLDCLSTLSVLKTTKVVSIQKEATESNIFTVVSVVITQNVPGISLFLTGRTSELHYVLV